MGFDYKILCKLNQQNIHEIEHTLIIEHAGFSRQHYDDYKYIEYRSNENQDPKYMPDLTLSFDPEGINLCKNSMQPIWVGIQMIQDYLTKHQIDYQILDYSY